MWNNPNPYGGAPPPMGGGFPAMNVGGAPPPNPYGGAPAPAFDAFPPAANPYGGAPPMGGNPYGGAPPPMNGNPYGGAPPPMGGNPYGGAPPPMGGNPYGGAPPMGGNPYGGAPPPNQYGAPPMGGNPYGGAPPMANQYGAPPPNQYGAPMGGGYGAPPGGPMRAAAPGNGNRKAVLIGINYLKHQRGRLKGCINDVKNMQNFLLQRGFQQANMRILTDDLQDASRQPTRANILRDLRWLASGARPGDSLFFHFSGHGSQVVDTSGDEDDGMDETILPVDYNTAGQIIDDDLHEILVAPLPSGCRLTSLMDCCHSGTGLDLPYTHNLTSGGSSGGPGYATNGSNPLTELMGVTSMSGLVGFGFKQVKKKKKKKKKKKYSNQPQGELPGTSKADVMLFSGCRDDQTSADTSIGGEATGAMTWAFTSALAKNSNLTYLGVLQAMRDVLNGSGKYTQVPQLSTGRKMDLNQPFSL